MSRFNEQLREFGGTILQRHLAQQYCGAVPTRQRPRRGPGLPYAAGKCKVFERPPTTGCGSQVILDDVTYQIGDSMLDGMHLRVGKVSFEHNPSLRQNKIAHVNMNWHDGIYMRSDDVWNCYECALLAGKTVNRVKIQAPNDVPYKFDLVSLWYLRGCEVTGSLFCVGNFCTQSRDGERVARARERSRSPQQQQSEPVKRCQGLWKLFVDGNRDKRFCTYMSPFHPDSHFEQLSVTPRGTLIGCRIGINNGEKLVILDAFTGTWLYRMMDPYFALDAAIWALDDDALVCLRFRDDADDKDNLLARHFFKISLPSRNTAGAVVNIDTGHRCFVGAKCRKDPKSFAITHDLQRRHNFYTYLCIDYDGYVIAWYAGSVRIIDPNFRLERKLVADTAIFEHYRVNGSFVQLKPPFDLYRKRGLLLAGCDYFQCSWIALELRGRTQSVPMTITTVASIASRTDGLYRPDSPSSQHVSDTDGDVSESNAFSDNNLYWYGDGYGVGIDNNESSSDSSSTTSNISSTHHAALVLLE